MGREIFGTDGVRGRANSYPMTAEMALKLGNVVGRYFANGSRGHRVVIGKDTRRSCYMLENALTAGLTSAGMDVFLFGPMPTPAIGKLTNSMRADLGVMISASHNPSHDNGIKFFGPDGFKLSDEVEEELEAMLKEDAVLAEPGRIGRAQRIDDVRGRYTEFAKMTFPRAQRLDGLRLVIDCANGAGYKTAPDVLYELGAEVIPMGVTPNGFNINSGVGSTHPEAAAAKVIETRADLGICLDGDGDRVILIDETGKVIDGDQIMAVIAMQLKKKGRLAGDTLVATVMSNLGLEKYLAGNGINLIRTKVGDRYVVEAMREGNYNLGGEQSGHIVLLDHVTTGDGLIAALQFLGAMVEGEKKASALGHVFKPVPQRLDNVRFTAGTQPLEDEAVKAAIADGERRFGKDGRLVIRKSGTEPLIRVMGECTDKKLLDEVVSDIAAKVAKV
ncbi:phosphoglucosamine mutase [Paracoccaceae bacterium GXU_MW_L88]